MKHYARAYNKKGELVIFVITKAHKLTWKLMGVSSVREGLTEHINICKKNYKEKTFRRLIEAGKLKEPFYLLYYTTKTGLFKPMTLSRTPPPPPTTLFFNEVLDLPEEDGKL